MKNIVLKDDFRVHEIRPEAEFAHYLELIEKDIENIFGNSAGVYFDYCPACRSHDSSVSFQKNTFTYHECNECKTFFVNPRPTKEMLSDFYEHSEGIHFWNSEVVQDTKSRKQHVIRPRVQWVLDNAQIKEQHRGIYLDFSSKYEVFLEELKKGAEFSELFMSDPADEVVQMNSDSAYQILKEEVPSDTFNVITAFEVVDRIFDPGTVFETVYDALAKDGLAFFTTRSGSGFDLRILKDNSQSLIPPIHLNLMTVEGLTSLLKRIGFEIVEMSSPGSLDLNLVENAIRNQEKGKEIKIPEFLDDIINHRSDAVKNAFQEFLQKARLSSHLRIIARKR